MKRKLLVLDIENNYNLVKKNYDIVYSRDTVLHQLEPFKFIKSLIDVAKDTLILRLRTRDLGSTIYDPEYSCQLVSGEEWVPYIVLNYDELIEFFNQISKHWMRKSSPAGEIIKQ